MTHMKQLLITVYLLVVSQAKLANLLTVQILRTGDLLLNQMFTTLLDLIQEIIMTYFTGKTVKALVMIQVQEPSRIP